MTLQRPQVLCRFDFECAKFRQKMSIKIGMLFKKLFQLIVLTHNRDMAFLSIHEGKLQLEKEIKNGKTHIFFSLRK